MPNTGRDAVWRGDATTVTGLKAGEKGRVFIEENGQMVGWGVWDLWGDVRSGVGWGGGGGTVSSSVCLVPCSSSASTSV